jgi:hypothetical protein
MFFFHFIKQRRLTTAAKKAIAKLNSRTVSKKVSRKRLLGKYEIAVDPADISEECTLILSFSNHYMHDNIF